MNIQVKLSKYVLQKHVKGFHEKLRLYQCNQCGYSASQRILLKRHVDVVYEKLTPYHCGICPHAASQNACRKWAHVYEQI